MNFTPLVMLRAYLSRNEWFFIVSQHIYSSFGDLMNFEHVAGKDKGNVRLFALSTCIWCKKTREFLSSLGVAFDYIYVDLLKGEERAEAIAEVKKYNLNLSFPTLVIGDKCIVGLKEKEIREALG
jgi:glutaredoxin